MGSSNLDEELTVALSGDDSLVILELLKTRLVNNVFDINTAFQNKEAYYFQTEKQNLQLVKELREDNKKIERLLSKFEFFLSAYDVEKENGSK